MDERRVVDRLDVDELDGALADSSSSAQRSRQKLRRQSVDVAGSGAICRYDVADCSFSLLIATLPVPGRMPATDSTSQIEKVATDTKVS